MIAALANRNLQHRRLVVEHCNRIHSRHRHLYLRVRYHRDMEKRYARENLNSHDGIIISCLSRKGRARCRLVGA